MKDIRPHRAWLDQKRTLSSLSLPTLGVPLLRRTVQGNPRLTCKFEICCSSLLQNRLSFHPVWHLLLTPQLFVALGPCTTTFSAFQISTNVHSISSRPAFRLLDLSEEGEEDDSDDSDSTNLTTCPHNHPIFALRSHHAIVRS